MKVWHMSIGVRLALYVLFAKLAVGGFGTEEDRGPRASLIMNILTYSISSAADVYGLRHKSENN